MNYFLLAFLAGLTAKIYDDVKDNHNLIKFKNRYLLEISKLFHMGDCDLIDSPGIREFSLGHISHEQLFHDFREFRNFSGMCKFRDCQHRSEPGCAIQTAALTGEISTERLGSYFQILQTIDGP